MAYYNIFQWKRLRVNSLSTACYLKNMKTPQNIVKIVCLCFAILTVDGFFSLARAPLPPGPKTPTSLWIRVNSVEIATKSDKPYLPILSMPSSIDLISQTGQPGSALGAGIVPQGEYKAIRLTLSATNRYSGTDPCTGDSATGAEIQLPEGSNGVVVINYEVPHPVTGLQQGFLLMQAFTVGAAPIEFRLVFVASNSVVCVSTAEPLRTIQGDNAELAHPQGVYMDMVNDEIVVANNVKNSVTIYNRDDNGNVTPLRTIKGPNTGLDGPIGIYVDTGNSEILVANNANDSVTAYNRDDNGDAIPRRTIKGSNTGLDGPGGIYIDTVNDEIIVANGGNNSVTIYSRTASGDVAPISTIKGSNTGLSSPCGVYTNMVNNEILVTNNRNDSVTIYSRTASGNITPLRTISGDLTGLESPCGVVVDTVNNEVVVANSGNDSITIYSSATSGNVAPLRTISGSRTGLRSPVGIYLDAVNNEIFVSNSINDSLTIHNWDDRTVQLKELPILINSANQQSLFLQYFYTGEINRDTGAPLSIDLDGYNFEWRITGDRVTGPGDASNGLLIPPSEIVFDLTDGSVASNLDLDCPVFTPFITLELYTNCPPSPLIRSPFPATGGDYRVAATLSANLTGSYSQVVVNKFPLTRVPVQGWEFPRLIPTFTLAANSSIQKIEWTYVNELNDELASPLIMTQKVQINLIQPYLIVSGCYQQVQGNAPNLVFDSGPLARDVRSVFEIKNNRCDILLDDVETITFIVTDGLQSNCVFDWKPI